MKLIAPFIDKCSISIHKSTLTKVTGYGGSVFRREKAEPEGQSNVVVSVTVKQLERSFKYT
jgi:hypothetical protein